MYLIFVHVVIFLLKIVDFNTQYLDSVIHKREKEVFMKKISPYRNTSIRLPLDVEAALDKIAFANKRSRSGEINLRLEQSLISEGLLESTPSVVNG